MDSSIVRDAMIAIGAISALVGVTVGGLVVGVVWWLN